MAITAYDIITASHPADLNAAIAAGGFCPVGQPLTGSSFAMQAVGVGQLDSGDLSDCEVVQGSNHKDLAAKVDAMIKDGFQPVGGVAKWAGAYVQTVAKIKPSDSGAQLKPVAAPKISVHDPADGTLLQTNFDDLIAALKKAGVFK